MVTINVQQETYRWKDSNWRVANTDKVDAQKFGERVAELREKYGESITPQTVVDDAASPDSPMHPLFEWNDEEAAEQWRVHQARHALNSLEVRVETKGGESTYINANVHVVEDNRHGYVSIRVAEARQEYIDQATEEALRYLKGFERRFNHLEEMRPVLDAIRRVEVILHD